MLERGAFWKQILKCISCNAKSLSRVPCSSTPWTVAHQVPLSIGLPRQECWGGLSCSPPGDLPTPRIKPASLSAPALAARFLTTSANWEGRVGMETSWL